MNNGLNGIFYFPLFIIILLYLYIPIRADRMNTTDLYRKAGIYESFVYGIFEFNQFATEPVPH